MGLFEFGTEETVDLVADDARLMGDVLHLRAEATPDSPAAFQKRDGRWIRWTWSELHHAALEAAKGLLDRGMTPGERIAILGPTHVEWAIYDLAGHLVGATSLGIYPNQSPEQIRYLLEHSATKILFVADENELETVLEAAHGLESLHAIVPWTRELATRYADRDPRITSPEAFRGDPLEVEISRQILCRIEPDAIALLVYTSGTTGPPKGAKISHANILAVLGAQEHIFEFRRNDLVLSFLPMAHVTERILAFYCRINTGVPAAYATTIGSVLDEVGEVRPTIFGSVPRLFEKAYGKVQYQLSQKPAPFRALFRWALGVGRRRFELELAGEVPDGWTKLQLAVARRLVFRKVHQAFGGRVRACLTGAAPISPDILEFFWAVELPLLEAYGMTEATVVTHINRLDSFRLGTVGKVVPPMECRLAEDDEILLRGPFVFQGYLGDEEATRNTVIDGWLHSGDIGTLDDDGFLRITDRKKHLIITAGGKNVAPANIERAIKSQSPLISQVHAHGDRRPFVSALIAPSPLETLDWGVEHGTLDSALVDTLREELLANPTLRSEILAQAMARVVAIAEFRELFLEPVRRGNRELARVERVRRFTILDRDFSQEAGEMTPTMKLRRKVIETSFLALFDRLYDDPDFGIDAES